MNINQIQFLRDLDKEGTFGTVQNVLMSGDMKDERMTLLAENERMRKALQKANLYTNEIALGREDGGVKH
jgi:hypothetical protein